ncbi:recombinase family protein [Amycolatopsis sp. FDAARGOS 1241]|nr:recombinase family protein [Amycolatopsis sp. FDAARGOS 1241]
MIDTLRAFDRRQLVVAKLDRLSRSLEHLLELSRQLHAKAWTCWCSTRASTPPPRPDGCSSRSWARTPRSNRP